MGVLSTIPERSPRNQKGADSYENEQFDSRRPGGDIRT